MHKYKNYKKMRHSLWAILWATAFILTVFALTNAETAPREPATMQSASIIMPVPKAF
jgi:hypothetical protein